MSKPKGPFVTHDKKLKSLKKRAHKEGCKDGKHSSAVLLQKSMLARTLAAAGKGDPTCKSGIASQSGGVQQQVCCPHYCGECSDYPTCNKVNGQASGNACCATRVAKMSCDSGKAQMNTCIKSCDEKGPPCILAEKVPFEVPSVTSAAEDCNEAVGEWMDSAETSITAADGGDEQWANLEYKGDILK